MTTYGTLAAAGESFFTSLLSGRHKNTTDDSGALFIDSERVAPEIFCYTSCCVPDIVMMPEVDNRFTYRSYRGSWVQNFVSL